MEVLSGGLTGLSLSVYYGNMTRNNLLTAVFTDLFIQSRTNGDNFLNFFSSRFRLMNTSHFMLTGILYIVILVFTD